VQLVIVRPVMDAASVIVAPAESRVLFDLPLIWAGRSRRPDEV
jgi:hypothetical protein